MDEDMITLDVEDHVAVVTMNRAPVNAFNRAMRDRIVAVFDEVSERDDIRVAVLTSSQKVFSAGADLKERPDPTVAGEFSSHNRITRETGNAIMECAKPVIAACNGTALGLGFALLTHCDIMLASEDATFGMPEINVGLAGGASMLKTVLGRSDMRLMFFTGRRLPAAELYRMNVLSAVYKADELMDAAMSLAREIASKSPVAMRYAKASCNIADLMPQKYAYRFEQDYTVALSKTEDAQEARAAFIEKRAPVFKGR